MKAVTCVYVLNMPEGREETVRYIIIGAVLATEIMRHFHDIELLKRRMTL
jgi:hypothetical protein